MKPTKDAFDANKLVQNSKALMDRKMEEKANQRQIEEMMLKQSASGIMKKFALYPKSSSKNNKILRQDSKTNFLTVSTIKSNSGREKYEDHRSPGRRMSDSNRRRGSFCREEVDGEVPLLMHYGGDPRAMLMGTNKFINDSLPPEIEERLPFLRKKVIQQELKDILIK